MKVLVLPGRERCNLPALTGGEGHGIHDTHVPSNGLPGDGRGRLDVTSGQGAAVPAVRFTRDGDASYLPKDGTVLHEAQERGFRQLGASLPPLVAPCRGQGGG